MGISEFTARGNPTMDWGGGGGGGVEILLGASCKNES